MGLNRAKLFFHSQSRQTVTVTQSVNAVTVRYRSHGSVPHVINYVLNGN